MKEQVKLTQWNFGVVLNVVVKYVSAIVNTDKIKIKCHNTNSLCITMKPTEIKETASQGENNGKKSKPYIQKKPSNTFNVIQKAAERRPT